MDLVIESLTKKVLENQWSPGPGPSILNYPLDYPLCYKHLQTSTNHVLGSQRPSKAGILSSDSSVKKYQQYRAPFNREDWKVDVRTKASGISV